MTRPAKQCKGCGESQGVYVKAAQGMPKEVRKAHAEVKAAAEKKAAKIKTRANKPWKNAGVKKAY